MKNMWKIMAVSAGILGCVLLSGCKDSRYQKIEVPGQTAAEEMPAEADVSKNISKNVSKDTSKNAAKDTSKNAAKDTSKNAANEASMEAFVKTAVKASVSFEERNETVYVNAQNLNIRTEPRQGSTVVTKLDTGAELVRTGYQEEWSRVSYQGQTCYAATRYLTEEKPEAAGAAAEAGEKTADGSSGAGASGNGEPAGAARQSGEIGLNPDWKYAGFAKITAGKAILYRGSGNRNGKVVCVNAGHGTSGGSSVKTQCHPDGTPKVTGGTTGAGATSAVAVSGGMQFADGTAEAKVTLALAKVLKDKLLAKGYDVLMIRESDDVQLDNIARTVIANNTADCHIALHWDSTTSNKGAFYMSVPDIASYRSMEPVASHWQEHHALGDSLIAGLKGTGVKIFSDGKMAMDLTQTSYSTIPSVDIELGDKVSDHSAGTLDTLASGLAAGIDSFFGN